MAKPNAEKQVPLCARCQPLIDALDAGQPVVGRVCDTCAVRIMHNCRVALLGRDAMAPFCEACAGRPAVGEPGREGD